MKIKIYQVDAFTSEIFKGNSAAVCPLEDWLPDDIMQSIAMENNLSETAFFLIKNKKFYIRWFSPTVEINMAGHPTLATAHIIFSEIIPAKKSITFKSKFNESIIVNKRKNFYNMNMPASNLVKRNNKLINVSKALNSEPKTFLQGRYGVAIYDNEEQIQGIKPNFDKILKLNCDGLAVSAPGKKCDFVSRFFAPKIGILEDPVTGSAHCDLIPFWAKELKKKNLYAKQLSLRGGELFCCYKGDRITLGGNAITYMKGEIII